MTDLKLIPGGDEPRESDPLLDETLAALAADSDWEAAFSARSVASQEAGVRVVEQALLRKKQSRRRAVAAGAVLCLAAGAALAFAPLGLFSGEELAGSVALRSGNVLIQGGEGHWSELGAEGAVAPGSAVRTANASSARIQTPWGASVALSEQTLLQFPESTESSPNDRVVQLLSGSINLDVPPLAANETFAVHASGHQVIVHGTQFSVSVAEEGAAPCVIVHRGVVQVKSPGNDSWLKAGQRSGCELPHEEVEATEIAALEDQPEQGAQAAKPVRSKNRSKKAPRSPEGSSLAEQNRIFQKALSQERAGDLRGARGNLQLLLKKYPQSPLAGQARAQLNQLGANSSGASTK